MLTFAVPGALNTSLATITVADLPADHIVIDTGATGC
jgi:hypothetical protein